MAESGVVESGDKVVDESKAFGSATGVEGSTELATGNKIFKDEPLNWLGWPV